MTTLAPDATAGSAHGGAHGRTRVVALGIRQLSGIVAALETRDDVEIMDTGSQVDDAAAMLEGGGVDSVLYITDAAPGWLEEVAAIRVHTKAPIVLLSALESGTVLDEALNAGVAEALLLPQVVENVAFALRRTGRDGDRSAADREAREAQVVTVFSPKGGIGKTVIATNLATMLVKEEGRHTLLLDLDLQFGDTAIVLGLEPEKTLHDLLSAPGELDADKLSGYATRHETGLDVLPAPIRPEEADLVSEAKLMHLFEVARASYDAIVVDSAPFLHGPILTALDQTSDLLVVCSAEVPALKDVNLSLNTLSMLAFPPEKIRLVVNHAHQKDGLRRKDVEDALGLKVAVEIPNDRMVPDGVNRGAPAVLLDANADFTRGVRELANLIRQDDAAPRKRGLFRRARR